MQRYLMAVVVALVLAGGLKVTADIFVSCASLDPNSWFYSLFCKDPAGGGSGGAG